MRIACARRWQNWRASTAGRGRSRRIPAGGCAYGPDLHHPGPFDPRLIAKTRQRCRAGYEDSAWRASRSTMERLPQELGCGSIRRPTVLQFILRETRGAEKRVVLRRGRGGARDPRLSIAFLSRRATAFRCWSAASSRSARSPPPRAFPGGRPAGDPERGRLPPPAGPTTIPLQAPAAKGYAGARLTRGWSTRPQRLRRLHGGAGRARTQW